MAESEDYCNVVMNLTFHLSKVFLPNSVYISVVLALNPFSFPAKYCTWKCLGPKFSEQISATVISD